MTHVQQQVVMSPASEWSGWKMYQSSSDAWSLFCSFLFFCLGFYFCFIFLFGCMIVDFHGGDDTVVEYPLKHRSMG